ncbi:response regulator transcription factor [Streptomyces avermitilis]|uniref:response regulator transcription factor n=1 Tax=Streptomyces avermitilis TaxID=33903 RepID=UPI0033AC9F54
MNQGLKRVAVLCDVPLLRQGIQQALSSAADLQIEIHSPGRGELAFQRKNQSDLPDVVLFVHSTLELIHDEIAYLCRLGCRVIVLSASAIHSDALTAIRAGALGYLDYYVEEMDLVTAIRTVVRDRPHIPASITQSPAGINANITERETQILELLAIGNTDREIARKLKISENTVHSHLDRLREKTGLRRRTDLARLALKQRITK